MPGHLNLIPLHTISVITEEEDTLIMLSVAGRVGHPNAKGYSVNVYADDGTVTTIKMETFLRRTFPDTNDRRAVRALLLKRFFTCDAPLPVMVSGVQWYVEIAEDAFSTRPIPAALPSISLPT